VDRWLRRGLESDRDAVERLVRQSLAAGAETGSRLSPAVVATGVAVIALAAAIVFVLPRGEPHKSGAETARRDGAVEMLTITNASGKVEVFYPGQRSGDESTTPKPPAPDPKELTIFNSNGIVAAIAPAPAAHHFIVGGEP
jgi:hypothetical protein